MMIIMLIFLQTWEMQDNWLHVTDFLREEAIEYAKQYHFRVTWSIPTRRKPVPQSTASVYFIIEISTVKPETFPIEVQYFVESNRCTHRPGVTRFREKWLKDIIESKVLLIDDLNI
uniref:A-kinase anchor protein 14 n=1 Tax=Erpetoichthys calabaricus TaxID=27687 RepID=A0A8C4SJF4_ERPCA